MRMSCRVCVLQLAPHCEISIFVSKAEQCSYFCASRSYVEKLKGNTSCNPLTSWVNAQYISIVTRKKKKRAKCPNPEQDRDVDFKRQASSGRCRVRAGLFNSGKPHPRTWAYRRYRILTGSRFPSPEGSFPGFDDGRQGVQWANRGWASHSMRGGWVHVVSLDWPLACSSATFCLPHLGKEKKL